MKKKGKEKQKLSGFTGTVYYCSPEVVKDKYDFDRDEWAYGVMMYLIKKLLEKDADKRIETDEVLKHEFFTME